MSDPRLILTGNGTRLQFTGGQPLMDRGLENAALISLFTRKGWCGNKLLTLPIGSDFEEECNKPITRSSLNRIRQAAEAALRDPAFGRVTVTVTNPTGHRLSVAIRIEPPGKQPLDLTLNKHGENWQSQANDPAYVKVAQ